MPFCTYCGQEFQRNEHLERHLTTHGNVKRFKCPVCHVSFTRGDVLQRHMAIHSDDTSSVPVLARSRPRTQTACQNCARMKAKCDANSPCTRCRTRDLRCDRRPKQTRKSVPNPASAIAEQPATQREKSLVSMDVGTHSEDGVNGGDDRAEVVETSIQVQIPHEQSFPSPNTDETESQQQDVPQTAAVLQPGASEDILNNGDSSQSLDVGIWDDIESIPIDCAMDGWIHYNPALNQTNFMDSTSLIAQPGDRLQYDDGVTTETLHQIRHGNLDSFLQINQSRDTRTSLAAIPEHQAVIQAQDYWTSFRCNPRKDVVSCPRTGGVLLGSLSHMPQTDNLWGWLDLNFPSPDTSMQPVSMPLLDNVRDKLSAISQSFLRKALDVHQLDPAASASSYPSPAADVSHGFLILPPVATLDHFLREYMRIFEPFYTLVPGGVMDANVLMGESNNSASTLLILLMISQGAVSDSSNEARRLSGGLTEVCRISLFDTIEKNVSVCHHHLLVHSALLFTIQAAWSGDKWLMDIGKGQRNIYLSILRNSGLFEALDSPGVTLPPAGASEAAWEATRSRWLERERVTRLVHTWAILDLELSLFQDLNPLIPLSEFNISLPNEEHLFLANDISSWQNELRVRVNEDPEILEQPSLRTLFQQFLDNDIAGPKLMSLNPTTLHLLLYPLHSLIRTFRELRSCFGPGGGPKSFSPITKRSTDLRMEELQGLLQRWLSLYRCLPSKTRTTIEERDTISPSDTAMLISYHIIALNTVVDFKELEQLARSRFSDQNIQTQAPRILEKCFQDQDKAVFHAGQVLHLLRNLEKKTRPPWWPAALYRATIILWAASVFYGPLWILSSSPYVLVDMAHGGDSGYGNLIVENLEALHIPALMNRGDTSKPVLLHDPICTVETCLLSFQDGATTRFSEGIQRKLREFLDRRISLQQR